MSRAEARSITAPDGIVVPSVKAVRVAVLHLRHRVGVGDEAHLGVAVAEPVHLTCMCLVISSAVLPRGCAAIDLPLRSFTELMPESARTTTWKYCG